MAKKNSNKKTGNGKPLRSVGYVRTSGEGQRNNTSIPIQKQAIEAKCSMEGWIFLKHYVDESKTGSQIEGRDDFKQMMKDATNDCFDVVVIYDISRFGRDGFDILASANTLYTAFSVFVVDSRGIFDTRNPDNDFINMIYAAGSHKEVGDIRRRTIEGREAKARQGKPWAKHPIGRTWDKDNEKWYVTDKGKKIAQALDRYLKGESLTTLCKELDLGGRTKISEWVHNGQLSGAYQVTFTNKKRMTEEIIPVPGIPEVVPASVLEKVKARLLHNRKFNRVDVKRYLLSGFVRCAECGRALSGTSYDGNSYYYHSKTEKCPYKQFRADVLESAILDYLYSFFLDEPAFNEAVERAMPSADRRQKLIDRREETEKRLKKNGREIQNLINAIKKGFDPDLSRDEQTNLKEEKQVMTNRLREIETELYSLPSVEQTEAAAMVTRLALMFKHKDRDWRSLSRDDIQKFLFHLFGEQCKMSDRGAFIGKDEQGCIGITFKGQVEFYDKLANSRPISKAMEVEVAIFNRKVDKIFEDVRQRHEQETALNTRERQILRPFPDYS
ncbi:MAG: recombinase family protein [Pirellulales bacterium]|nr:recombinase family protein [Pirellulales bacterium]